MVDLDGDTTSDDGPRDAVSEDFAWLLPPPRRAAQEEGLGFVTGGARGAAMLVATEDSPALAGGAHSSFSGSRADDGFGVDRMTMAGISLVDNSPNTRSESCIRIAVSLPLPIETRTLPLP